MTKRNQFMLIGSGGIILIAVILFFINQSNPVQTFIKCLSIGNTNPNALAASVDIYEDGSIGRTSSTTIPSTGVNIFINNNDKMKFYEINHGTTEVEFIDENYLTEISLGLIQGNLINSSDKRIIGKIRLNNSNSNVTAIQITCDKCNNGNTVVSPDAMGNYVLNRTTNGRTLITYSLNQKTIVLKVVSGNGDDLIHIDLAFDDGSQKGNGIRRYLPKWLNL